MSAFEQHKKQFQDIATEILSTFEKIVHAASTKIQDSRQVDPVTRDSFAHISTDNLPSALSNISPVVR